jgi:hypothetical protein
MGEGDRSVDGAGLARVAGNRAAEDAGKAQLGDKESQAEANSRDCRDQRYGSVAKAQQHAVTGQAVARCSHPLSHHEKHFI